VKRALLLVSLAACHEDAGLLAQVKRALVEREQRLQAYSFQAHAGAAQYTLSFRAPKSTLLTLESGALSFDGERFYERDDAARTFTTYAPELNAEQLALIWAQGFGARIPEGFRAPLLPPRGVTAQQVGDTVELTLHTHDEGKDVSVTSVLRWPGADFLERRTDYGGAKGALRMEREECDPQLKLCVPTQLAKWVGDQKVEQTELTQVQLNDAPARDAFVLTVPRDFKQEHSTLVPKR
jgi:hypothetical protein